MHIAFLDSWLQQVVDGSGTAAAIGGLGRALVGLGHRVTRVAPLSPWPTNLTARRILFNLHLPALLRAVQYDLVVGFDIDGFLYAGQRTNAPYICSIKGVIAEELQHEQGAIRNLLWSLSRLERINVRRAPRVITTSDYCRRAIVHHYGINADNIAIVPEGIELPRWQGNPTRPRDSATVLCVARQYPRKHIADLLHAFPAVLRRVPNATLVIIGDGPEHQRLRRIAAELGLNNAVRFLGGISDADVRDWYARSTVFCLPSVQEGFGIVFLEAMAAGLPIVATSAAAIPEVVPHRQAGTLVPPANPAALADALSELLLEPALRQHYTHYSRSYVQQYDWVRVAERFLEKRE
jgi:glycosyltransferase involved in cell wall biosynthesis